MEEKDKKKEMQENVFTKEQIVCAKIYADKRDLVVALLENDKSYTFKEVNGIIEKFKKGKVN